MLSDSRRIQGNGLNRDMVGVDRCVCKSSVQIVSDDRYLGDTLQLISFLN
jgi:hypothetical protein